MGTRCPNPRLVKIHRTYTVEEISRRFRVHKNTVRAWIKSGLATCDSVRPTLVLGRHLADFLTARRAANKRTCKAGEIYCVRCRAPKAPDIELVEYQPITATLGNLIAMCPDCESIINRRVNATKLPQISGRLNVTVPQAQPRIDDTP